MIGNSGADVHMLPPSPLHLPTCLPFPQHRPRQAAFASPPSPPRAVFKPFGAPGASLSEGVNEAVATDHDVNHGHANGHAKNYDEAPSASAGLGVGVGAEVGAETGAGAGVNAPFLSDKDEEEFMNPTPTIRDAWRAASKPGSAKKGRRAGGGGGQGGANAGGDEGKEVGNLSTLLCPRITCSQPPSPLLFPPTPLIAPPPHSFPYRRTTRWVTTATRGQAASSFCTC